MRGAAEVVGVVERVDFTRTIIRDDFDVPVSVPNRVRSGPQVCVGCCIQPSVVRTQHASRIGCDKNVGQQLPCILQQALIVSCKQVAALVLWPIS